MLTIHTTARGGASLSDHEITPGDQECCSQRHAVRTAILGRFAKPAIVRRATYAESVTATDSAADRDVPSTDADAGRPVRTAAFFDLDKTVIAKSSTLAFSKPFFDQGLINRQTVLKSATPSSCS